MKLTSFLVQEAFLPTLAATTREAAIEEMIRKLHSVGKLPGANVEDIIAAVKRREELGSTGIGRGVAIPHSRHRDATKLVGTVALAPAGLAYDAIDGDPVKILFILISPEDQPGPHLRALDAIVQRTKDDAVLAKLLAAKTAEELWEYLQ